MSEQPVKHIPVQKKKRVIPTAWKPGQSGNPNGRPKKELTMTDALKKKLYAVKYGLKDKTNLDIIVDQIIRKAVAGDMWAIGMIYDRIEGKALERVITRDADRDELIVE
jgi:hypothetical protein